jgi:tetratricopeptide (TPR) repeat protein
MDFSNVDTAIVKTIKEADKLSAAGGSIIQKFRNIFDYSTQRTENANLLYLQAINGLMMLNPKRWDLIIELRLRRIKNFIKLDDYSSLYNEHQEVAKILLKKTKSYHDAIHNYKMAIDYCKLTNGNMKKIQDFLVAIAQIYDTELVDYPNSIEYYSQAVEVDDNSGVYKIHMEIARLNSELEFFEIAKKSYETAGDLCIDHDLLRWNIKNIYFMATLCGICIEKMNFLPSYEEYKQKATKFNGTLENKLIEGIFESLKEENVDMFVAAITEYEKLTGQLPTEKIKLLLHIKKAMASEDELC